MKHGNKNIKKIIKRKLNVKMNERDKKRISGGKPKINTISNESRNEIRGKIRRGIKDNILYNENKLNFSEFDKKFVRKEIVDYDAIIIISSYNRYKKLVNLLKQLTTQETKYKIKIIIYNDGSTDIKYKELINIFNNIDYIESEINNGKHKYWESITKLFKKSSEYSSYVTIQIDDDFILCNNFIDVLIDKFFEGKEQDNKNVAIHYHLPEINTNRSWWGMKNGIDGGAIFDSEFLKTINFEINPISKNRWKYNEELSSGVWKQLSETINKNGLLTYKLEYSLAKHIGNNDSKMNKKQRDNSPINTYNYKKDIK